jgi:hypothetical protein
MRNHPTVVVKKRSRTHSLTTVDVPTIEIDENAAFQIRPMKSQWKVEVKFSGYPVPMVTWMKNDERISDDKCKTYLDAGSTTIAIYSVEKENTGTYTVIATNTAGSAAANLQLKVIGSYLSTVSL